MAQFYLELRNHGVHLIFQVEFLLLQFYFLQVVVLGHVLALVEFLEFNFRLMMLPGQTAEVCVRGHQLFLDLILFPHHILLFGGSGITLDWGRAEL